MTPPSQKCENIIPLLRLLGNGDSFNLNPSEERKKKKEKKEKRKKKNQKKKNLFWSVERPTSVLV